jgi:DNA ligase-4
MRDDKEWFNCMTTDELDDLKRIASGHLAYKHYDGERGEEDGPPTKKRKGGGVKVGRPKGVAMPFRHTDVTGISEVSIL